MKAKTYQEPDGTWGWSILNEYGDEIGSSTNSFPTRELAREEMYAAFDDFGELI